MSLPMVLYIPTKKLIGDDRLSVETIIQWHHNGFRQAWSFIDENSSYSTLRAIMYETCIVEQAVFTLVLQMGRLQWDTEYEEYKEYEERKEYVLEKALKKARDILKYDQYDFSSTTNRYHQLKSPKDLVHARVATMNTFYEYIMKSCPDAYKTLHENQRAWNDIYKLDSRLFDDETEGWQGLVALTPDRGYLGHVYIRRGSRFGRNLHGSQNQLDYMEMLGIRQSLYNLVSCHGPNTPRWSLSKVLLRGVQQSVYTNKLLGVDVYDPLPVMTRILQTFRFRNVGCDESWIRHMRATTHDLTAALDSSRITNVHCLNGPLVFMPCRRFIYDATSDYMSYSTSIKFPWSAHDQQEWETIAGKNNLLGRIESEFNQQPLLSISALRHMELLGYPPRINLNSIEWENILEDTCKSYTIPRYEAVDHDDD